MSANTLPAPFAIFNSAAVPFEEISVLFEKVLFDAPAIPTTVLFEVNVLLANTLPDAADATHSAFPLSVAPVLRKLEFATVLLSLINMVKATADAIEVRFLTDEFLMA